MALEPVYVRAADVVEAAKRLLHPSVARVLENEVNSLPCRCPMCLFQEVGTVEVNEDELPF